MFRTVVAWAAVAVLCVHSPIFAQPAAEPTALRPVLDGLQARCIGPANMGGRVVDLAVVEGNPSTFYVATAGGGIWKTTNGGGDFAPIFDNQPTLCTGSVDLCQAKPDVVYVASGEGNPRNSVSWGNGVYRSTDGGKSWTHCGLEKTHHIGRIVAHPTNPEIAYVAALGRFWGPNPERGLYKTTDGGKSWTMIKFIDENTGFVDLQMDPTEPERLYAAAWQVRRDGFAGGNPATQTGPNGGLFKSTDGGKTWEKMAGGLPERGYGRCGISIHRKNPNILFAVVQTDKTAALTNNGQAAKSGEDVTIGGVFHSTDAGKTWKKLNDAVPRPFYYGQIRVDPVDEKLVYVLGVQTLVSTDGGHTFAPLGRTGVHADHHALWIDPKNPEHLILGTDGGLYISRDRAKSFTPVRNLVLGQFYGVAVDSRTPYRVYGGLQDNGSWGGPSATPYADGISLPDWQQVLGGDGFQCAVDPTDPNIVYAESQYGGLIRITLGGAKSATKSLRIPSPKGMPPYRFNWNSPILISPHNAATVYYAGQYVFRSTKQGEAWEKISPDLTRGPKDAAVTNSGHTITTTAESPVSAGVLWAGTDDGKVWISKDDGKEWLDLSENIPNVPADRWITRIECSHTDAATAYLSIDRHRNDDFKPYLFRTTDSGKTWVPLHAGLPNGAVIGVVRESSHNKDLLFVGTELGLYASLDAGKTWHHLNQTGFPACVRVDDLVIHPRERELVIGTHGRSIWIMDIAPLEQLSSKVLAADAHLFDLKPVTLLKMKERPMRDAKLPALPKMAFEAKNPHRGITVHYLLGTTGKAPTLEVRDADGNKVAIANFSGQPKAGLHTAEIVTEKAGEYTITLKVGEMVQTKKVKVQIAE